MSWRQRAVVLGLAAVAMVGLRYHKRLLHLVRRLFASTQPDTLLQTPPSHSDTSTLLGVNFPRDTILHGIFASPGYLEPLWPDPTTFILTSPFYGSTFAFSFFGLLRSFTPKPAFQPAIQVKRCSYMQFEMPRSLESGAFILALNKAKAPWGVILAFTPLPCIVKTGPLLGITPDLIGEVEAWPGMYKNFFWRRDGLLHCSHRPNGDVILVLGQHINQDTRLAVLRLSPIDYGWDVVAYNSHTIQNGILAFFQPSLIHARDQNGMDLVQTYQATGQTTTYLQVALEYDQLLFSHRLLNPDEVEMWSMQTNRQNWPKPTGHARLGRIIPRRNFSIHYIVSVDKEQRLWLNGSSSCPLSLKTLAFLALARKYHTQLDHLASLPRGLESIGIPESIGREYRRQLTWATPQPPLILDLTASPPVLKSIFASFPEDDSQYLDTSFSFES